MITTSLVVSSVLALVLLASSVMKFRRAPAVVATLVPLGVLERAIPGLGILELAATLGLFAGLFWWPLGADYVIAPAAVLRLASVAALALILASS